ncbi:helix-turn-helix domain-containing protein [Halomicroarcula sp. F13]|uniref:Helix-turn-helix domain-containing protein n=1 Tax=Haloarcula rubra TaxID=2487747 RepID=A0AAW4PUX3_9EURY|nr:bacterio-opsin activator domain-containing protein [Halomicroarcula rubra]MBX0324300.1 helix-turn-helix domain-containing protein [Halomicroarcula rubra]
MASDVSHVTLDWPATVVVVGESERVEAALEALTAEHDGARVVSFKSPRAALTSLEDGGDADVIVSTKALDSGSGVDLLRHVTEAYPDLPFVLAGADVTVTDERTAIEAGATDVVRLDPADSSGDGVLRARVRRALEGSRPRERPRVADRSDAPRLLGGTSETIRRLFEASTREAVAEAVVESATKTLDNRYAAVYLLDSDGQHLRRVAAAPVDDDSEGPVRAGQGTRLWETFVTGDVHRHRGASVGQETGADGASVTLPIGEFGVLDVAVDGPDDEAVGAGEQLTNLATAATAALEQIAESQSLQRQAAELDERAGRLERRRTLVDALSTVQRAAIEAESQDELEQRVVNGLADTGQFAFVRIERVGSQRDRLEPRTWAGAERGYLDAVDLRLDESVQEPAVRAARTRSTLVVDDITTGLRDDTWREEALTRGYQSVLSVPLYRDDRLWGTLTVHATDADAFDDEVAGAFDDIASAISNGISVVERKRSLLSDTVIDLELTLTDGTDLFSRVARETGATLDFEGVLARDNSAVLFLVVTDAEPAAVERAFESAPLVDAVDHVPHGDGELYEIELESVSLVSEILSSGGTLRDLTADGDTTRLLVTLPAETDVRRFVESLEQVAPDVRLHSRTQRTRPSRRDQPFRVEFEQRLTDRQLEALRTALLSGYFEWPREHTAEEVASLLDISQPTFNRHLRVSLKKLLELLFDVDEE